MRTRALEFKVGLLIVVAAAALIGFVFVLGNFSLRSGYTIYVDYDFSGNIRPGAPVKVSGIKVGKVEDIRFLAGAYDEALDRRVYVRLEVWIEDRVREAVRADSEFFINTAGVLGEQYLEIVPGDDYERPPIASGTIVRGIDPPRTDLVVARLYEVLDSISAVLRDDRELIDRLLTSSAGAVDQVNAILTENRDQVGALIGQTTALAGEATQTLAKLNAGIGDPRVLGQTVRDADKLLVTTEAAIGDLAPRAAALLDDATRVTGTVTEARIDTTIAAVDRAATAADKAGGLIDNVDGMVTDLRRGKGSAGALLARDELYADLRELIRDLRRNPWKLFWKE